jgi:flavodoxin
MNVLVLYDSKSDTTKRIATAIAGRLAKRVAVRLQALGDDPLDLSGVDLLVVGGSTYAHGMSLNLQGFLRTIPAGAVYGMAVATFDTRLRDSRYVGGSAAVSAGGALYRQGARLVAPPESFFVGSGSGPLEDGEIERAATWGARLLDQARAMRSAPALLAQ